MFLRFPFPSLICSKPTESKCAKSYPLRPFTTSYIFSIVQSFLVGEHILMSYIRCTLSDPSRFAPLTTLLQWMCWRFSDWLCACVSHPMSMSSALLSVLAHPRLLVTCPFLAFCTDSEKSSPSTMQVQISDSCISLLQP